MDGPAWRGPHEAFDSLDRLIRRLFFEQHTRPGQGTLGTIDALPAAGDQGLHAAGRDCGGDEGFQAGPQPHGGDEYSRAPGLGRPLHRGLQEGAARRQEELPHRGHHRGQRRGDRDPERPLRPRPQGDQGVRHHQRLPQPGPEPAHAAGARLRQAGADRGDHQHLQDDLGQRAGGYAPGLPPGLALGADPKRPADHEHQGHRQDLQPGRSGPGAARLHQFLVGAGLDRRGVGGHR